MTEQIRGLDGARRLSKPWIEIYNGKHLDTNMKTTQDKIHDVIELLNNLYNETADYDLARKVDSCIEILTGLRDI